MSSRSQLLAVLLFAAILRGGVLWVMRDNLNEDRDAYRQIAENLTTHGVYGLGNGIQTPRPTAYRPPLYPVLLAKIAGEDLKVTPLRVAMLHWALGVGTAGLSWVVAGIFCRSAEDLKPSGTDWRSAIAALLVACDPILLHWSTYVMTETLAAFLTILALYTLARFHFDRRPMNAGFAGCALGLAILCRPTFLPWAALSGLLFLPASGGVSPLILHPRRKKVSSANTRATSPTSRHMASSLRLSSSPGDTETTSNLARRSSRRRMGDIRSIWPIMVSFTSI